MQQMSNIYIPKPNKRCPNMTCESRKSLWFNFFITFIYLLSLETNTKTKRDVKSVDFRKLLPKSCAVLQDVKCPLMNNKVYMDHIPLDMRDLDSRFHL